PMCVTFVAPTACRMATNLAASLTTVSLPLMKFVALRALFASLGTEKVRLTGGEPSLRRDFYRHHCRRG
ncbi:hypothetical protein SEEA0322_08978, partial [Salmonella enterica subsp. enterica serovar Agona str. 0322]